MAGFWGRRKRNADEITEQDEVLAARAAKALVAADEKLRLTQDEMAFATAELGEAATADLRAAIEGVRTAMSEAFKLHQLNVDDIPDTPQELRERNARIVQLTEWAEDLLETKTGELESAVAKVREAPAVVESVQEQSRAVRSRLEETQQALERLAQRYSPRRCTRSTRTAPRPSSSSGSPTTACRWPPAAARPVRASRPRWPWRRRPRACAAPPR